jgi:methionyl-tRNA synthetase
MKEELTEYITNAKEMPEHVKNMALRWIEELHDWDVSRNLTWGVPIPKSNGQVMYVWIEAPIGYVSFTKELGEIWKDYWISKDVQSKITHFIGKDITVHHAVFWPGILKGVKNYKMPDSVVSGGYLTLENKKMSTSKNWVVWVKDFVEKFSPDYLRYFLMVNAPLNRDTDFSWDDFQKRINTELIDIIGNFSHRTLVFTERKFGKIPNVQKDTLKEEDLLLIRKCEKTTETFDKLIREYNFKDAIMEIILLSKEGNAYFQAMQPWAITDEERLKEVMYTCCTTLKYIVYLLSPFMPVKTGELLDLMNEELDLEIRGNDLKKPKVIFTKLEEMDILKMKEKLNSEIKFEEKVSKNEKTAKKTGAKMELIDIEYFTKVDLRVGKVLEVEDVKKSKKLYKIIVDLGNEQRQIISGLKGDYEVEELIGKNVIVICNLKPAKLCGVESEGMLLAAESDGIVSLLNIDREISLGSKIH